MKKDKRKKGSFIWLLVRSYAIFTVVVLLVIGTMYGLISFEIAKKFRIPNTEAFNRYQNALASQQFDKFPTLKVLGRKGAFQILNDHNKIIYKSGENMPLSYTEGELLCMQEFGIDSYYEITQYKGQGGETQILVTRSTLDEAEREEIFLADGFVLLNSDYQVLTNEMDLPMEQLTKQEYEYLTNTTSKEYTIQKYSFVNSEGEHFTAIFQYENAVDEDYDRLLLMMQRIWYLLIPIYILIVGIFIFVLNKKVKKPLMILNERIDNFSQDGYEMKKVYSGPNEFVEIGDSFEKLSGRLKRSEIERKKADADKQKMLADISHDLKTPITVIHGYSKAICDGIIPKEKQEQYLRTIYAKSTSLTELIDTFYEYSKMQHPSFQLVTEEVDICEYIREYLAEKYNEINLAGFELQVDIPEEPCTCKIDKMQMNRVFDNLIANAMKHNKAGTIFICQVYIRDNAAQIIIGDDGVGIPKELVPHIFEAFVVGDESRSNRQGTGLGLAIAKKIITSHKGTITLNYPPQQGFSTEFQIKLPKV